MMTTGRLSILTLGIAISIAGLAGCGTSGPRAASGANDKPLAPKLEGLGNWSLKITTSRPEAQQFFDQGLRLVYAFNHEEASRSFQEAARLDPNCAMCYWGIALAMAPNINDPMPSKEREQKAFDASRKAVSRKRRASGREQAFIDAMASRFSASAGADRLRLNQAYAAAMKQVAAAYPSDADAQILYADAVMNTMPWNYWTRDGRPQPGVAEVIELVEQTLRRHPNHAGAHHVYIHLVEASQTPERALESAARLGELAPGAGHLVHMPGHIYIRLGRYADVIEVNRKAVAADDAYITQCRSQGLYPAAYHSHNWHFLWAGAAMSGRYREAIQASRQLVARAEEYCLRKIDVDSSQFYRTVPYFTLVRFGKWDAILEEPPPEKDLHYAAGAWHYARGFAWLRKGSLREAGQELEQLRRILREEKLRDHKFWGINSLHHLLEIAREVLEGELAAARKDFPKAIAHLERAVRLEDSLTYNEPPDWQFPVRQSLGAVLLAAGRPVEAETVYWEDLRRNPENGWSLYGVTQALKAQGREEEAARAEARFRKAWAEADVQLAASRF